MAFKDLVVFLDSKKASAPRAALAAQLARRFDAHLAGVHIMSLLEPARVMHRTTYDRFYTALEKAAQERATAAERTFNAALTAEGIAGEWRLARVGYIDDGIVHARYADLAIVGQIDPDDHTLLVPELAPEEVMLAAGRPVLVVPYAGRFATVGERVLVAWNASREAARAVNDALPLLTRAKTVTVLSVNPVIDGARHGELPGADVAVHLARHGVKVSIEKSHVTELEVADVLLNRASDLGADLIVAGGYGRSRTSELILGGVTRDLLGRMTVPVLMSH